MTVFCRCCQSRAGTWKCSVPPCFSDENQLVSHGSRHGLIQERLKLCVTTVPALQHLEMGSGGDKQAVVSIWGSWTSGLARGLRITFMPQVYYPEIY